MIALSHKAHRLLDALRQHAEGQNVDGWRSVYLDNARPSDFTPRQFAWHLSSLSHAGLYRPIDGFAFGSVKMED